jgi:tetratricopeptide (TPR) repeat protein
MLTIWKACGATRSTFASNTGYGHAAALRRGQFPKASATTAPTVKRATWKNPTPYDSEPYLGLGLSLYYQQRMAEAFDALYKCGLDRCPAGNCVLLSGGDCRNAGQAGEALELVERALVRTATT